MVARSRPYVSSFGQDSLDIRILDSETKKETRIFKILRYGSVLMPNPLKSVLQAKWKRSVPSFGTMAESALNISEGELAVITYTSAADKMKVFSAFIREGLENGDQVLYTYPDEEGANVRKKLVQNGIDQAKGEKSEKSGSLILRSSSEHYLTDGKFDKMNAIKKELELRGQAKTAGYKHFRNLNDVGNLSFLKGEWQMFIDYWDDARVRAARGIPRGSGLGILCEPFIMELTAINVEGMSEKSVRGILNALGGGKHSPTRLIDFLEYTHAFSKRIGISHEELVGRKLLLEFDPASDYESVVEDFAKEALAHLEPVYIFTRRASSLRESLAQQRSIRFALMSSSDATSKSISENEIVLPADNTPLILDMVRRIGAQHADEYVFLVFDNLSELIMHIGFDKTYKFLLCLIEMLSLEKTTALFLLNKTAHETNVTSQIRGLFHNLLAYENYEFEIVKNTPNL